MTSFFKRCLIEAAPAVILNHVGSIWSHFRTMLDTLGRFRGPCGTIWGHVGSTWNPFENLFERFEPHRAKLKRKPRCSQNTDKTCTQTTYLEVGGAFWIHLGDLFVHFGAHWGHVVPSTCNHLGTILGKFRTIWGTVLVQLWSWGAFGDMWGAFWGGRPPPRPKTGGSENLAGKVLRTPGGF